MLTRVTVVVVVLETIHLHPSSHSFPLSRIDGRLNKVARDGENEVTLLAKATTQRVLESVGSN